MQLFFFCFICCRYFSPFLAFCCSSATSSDLATPPGLDVFI